MRRALQLLGLLLAALSLGLWLALGAHRGWTRTSVPVKTLDEVTGIEGVEYRRRFVPGLELLAGALTGSSVLAGASFLFRNQQTKPTK